MACLLRLAPANARLALDSLLSLPPAEFAALCGDPSVSRHVVEPLLELEAAAHANAGDEGGAASAAAASAAAASAAAAPAVPGALSPELAWAKNKIFAQLRGHFASLAATRFGCWVVSKAFSALDAKRKGAIAAELSEGERAILGARGPGGAALLKLVRLSHFRSSREGWEALFARQGSRQEALTSILRDVGKAAGAGAGAAGEQEAKAGEEGEEAATERALPARAAFAPAVPAAAAALSEGDAGSSVAAKAARKAARRARHAEAAAAAAAAAPAPEPAAAPVARRGDTAAMMALLGFKA
jgi:hypothetical protein